MKKPTAGCFTDKSRTMKYRFLTFVQVILCVACTSCMHVGHTDFDVDDALAQCDRQVHRALRQLAANGPIDTTMMPRNVAAGDSAWTCRPLCAAEWCSGFWPGILWLSYEATPSAEVRRAAIDATLAMHRIIDAPVLDHDLGFLMFCSAGTGWRVLQQELQRSDLDAGERAEDEAMAARFSDFCLRAADSLATLFRPTVGTFLSWPRNVPMFGGHNTIIDNMINLEMLCWAAKHGGRPELKDMAVRHAETTMQHHFRPDATTYHVAVYDTLDGHFIHGVTHQGLADSSMWARGQAWAVYGFTMMARETGDARFLQQACRAADVFIQRLPDDGVPFWDFDDPRIATSPAQPAAPSESVAPRDASAAAVVASALIELSGLVDAEQKRADGTTLADFYFLTAERMLASLSSSAYQAEQQSCAFLLHSTGNHPKQSEVDIPIIYADYYYIEALNRYRNRINKQ